VRIIPLVDAPPLYRLVIDQPLKLQLTLPERHRTEVKLGQLVELEVESHPNQLFKANISRINPAVDRDNRTFTVEILVPNEDRKLSSGSFAKANIVIRDDAQAITVPEEAIVTFAGISKVFVLEGEKVRPVTIKPGASKIITEGNRQRTWVQIEGAIKPGMTLVTSGFTRLADGITVKVRSAAEKQS
jgi:RND family efflux transporter MFP subunit